LTIELEGWYTKVRYAIKGILGLVVSVAIICSQAHLAYAGTYVMRSCNVPGERTAPAAPWTWIDTINTFANDECASGGGFGFHAGVMQRMTTAALVLQRPEGPQRAINIQRVRLWMVARLSGGGSGLYVAATAAGNTGSVYGEIFGPPGGSTLTSPYVSPVLLADTASYVLVLSCSGSTNDGCTPASPNPLEVRGAEVTLEEDVAPTGTVDGGSLLEGGVQSGTRNINYAMQDQESGVAEVSAVLGTTVVATQDFSPECAYANFAACPQSRNGVLEIDTRKVPDGSYPLSLRVKDAAGNREAVQASRPVQIVNGLLGPGVRPNGEGATGDAKLTATFVGRRSATARVSYSRPVVIQGRLTASSGKPIGKARLDVVETPVLPRARGITKSVLTRADGSYRYVIHRHSSSRAISVRYRPNLGDWSIAATARLRMNVAAAAIFRVALRGVRVSYGGRVLTRPIPRGGKLIYIEGRAVGGAWTRFAVRRTNRSGTFSGRYRLRVRRPGIRLQFRISIPNERGYPYVASVGRAVTRAVR
jgi:hypothetical protein